MGSSPVADVWELSEILNLVKNEFKAKERSSFMLSHTSDQYQDHTTAALLKELAFFVTKRIIYHVSAWKCQIPKHVFLYCTEKSFVL